MLADAPSFSTESVRFIDAAKETSAAKWSLVRAVDIMTSSLSTIYIPRGKNSSPLLAIAQGR
jgi:hypothetical protein